jgi:Bacterial archaeo-eukaryotic release factor family 7
MDIVTTKELKTLLDRYPGWCASMFMPTHRTGRETEQDPIRFGNLLSEVEERLLAKGLRSPDVREMLKPAQRLSQEPAFWRHQSDGLAAFFMPEAFHSYRLPLPFEELVVISNRFHLKPLLPFFTGDGHFYVLALSQNQVRLLEGTRHTVDEVDLESMPKSMAEALQYERFEKQLQFHTGTSSGMGRLSAMFHGHAISDEDKDRILRWFHRIDDELPTLLAGERSPMVLASVEYLFPLYTAANTYPHLLGQGISGNPEELTPEELHAQAWTLVQPIFMQAQEEAVAQYSQLAGTGQTTVDVKEAVLAAHHGRVDVLFVAVGVQVWGAFDPDTNAVHVHQEPEPGDEDLLDLAAIQSILNGGTVYAVEPEQVPNEAPLAATFRY